MICRKEGGTMAKAKTRNARRATRAYEAWLGSLLRLLPADLEAKHAAMRKDRFAFLRATFYLLGFGWCLV
jgi:uncharacterized protein (DUF2252 family)